MTHTYKITGATCNSCLNTIKDILSKLPEVESCETQLEPPVATIKLNKHVNLDYLNQALVKAGKSKYILSNEEMINQSLPQQSIDSGTKTTTWKDYMPLLAVFAYIVGGTFILSFISKSFTPINLMLQFMGLWFVFFSLFKFLDLKGFAEGYSMYDLVSKKWFSWGYIYPFLELGFGVTYLLGYSGYIFNSLVFVVMIISSLGVINNIRSGSKFQCACLGTVLKVPLTQISLYENLLMAGMAAIMFFN